MNYQSNLRKADINIATNGDNTIIAAPATGNYLAIDFIRFGGLSNGSNKSVLNAFAI